MTKELVKNLKENKYFSIGNSYYEINNVTDDDLEYVSFGGGFVKKIPLNAQEINEDFNNSKLKFTNKVPSIYKTAKLSFDHWENDNLECYNLKNHNWNGWSYCYATLEQVKKFNSIQKKYGLSSGLYQGTDIFKIIDDDTITIKEYETYEKDKMETLTIKSHMINCDGVDVKVFDLMSCNWTWSEE